MNVSHEHCLALLDKYANLLRLYPQWEINLYVINDIDEADQDHLLDDAYICFNDGYDECDIYLHTFRLKDERELKITICHEVCHIVMREVDKLLHSYVDQKQQEFAMEAVERAITHISRAIVDAC